jgi:hypothetical protein
MYKNFNITEQEKQQIMEMHQSRGYKMSIQENIESAKVQHHVDNMVNNLSDEQVHELLQQLNSVGITPNTSVKHAVNVVKNQEAMEMQQDMDENAKKQKAAELLSNIGSGLVGSTLVPIIPLALGHALNIGFAGGLAVHIATAGLLIALAKALGKKEGSTEHGNY